MQHRRWQVLPVTPPDITVTPALGCSHHCWPRRGRANRVSQVPGTGCGGSRQGEEEQVTGTLRYIKPLLAPLFGYRCLPTCSQRRADLSCGLRTLAAALTCHKHLAT